MNNQAPTWQAAFEDARSQALNVDAFTFQIAWVYALACTEAAIAARRLEHYNAGRVDQNIEAAACERIVGAMIPNKRKKQ